MFLTLVTHRRRKLFDSPTARRLLHEAMDAARVARPWQTDGIVLLPDHLHVLWRLPEDDHDYVRRVTSVKLRFTRAWLAAGGARGRVTASQRRQRHSGVWQKRYWEHTIRDARDFQMHLDYIHGNPVKHKLVSMPVYWPWSSFHRYVEAGGYAPDWCGRVELPGAVEYMWPE